MKLLTTFPVDLKEGCKYVHIIGHTYIECLLLGVGKHKLIALLYD
jgi:hypothetical protein